MRLLIRIKNYLKEAFIESKKITWPGKKTTWRHTWIVILMTFSLAAFLGLCDSVFTWIFKEMLLK